MQFFYKKRHYEQVAYIRMDKDEEMKQSFSNSGYNINRMIRDIEVRMGFKLIPGKTLIILDEIQECPPALTSLKYFCEEAREHHIIAAGSLPGVTQHSRTRFPVGKAPDEHPPH